jgi:hypothetical protein
VLLASGAEKIEMLRTQISLWSISRAISTALVLAALEMMLFLFRPLEIVLGLGFFIVYFALAMVALAVATGAYARVCSTLFACVYVTTAKPAQPIDQTGLS